MTTATIEAPTDKYQSLSRFRIHYVEAGTGHPLILLHGGGPGATGMTNYGQNIGPLAQHFRVLALDMPGWGDSDPQTRETGFDHPGVLIEFLDALGIDRAALVGNSMGGMTSVTTATRFPERVSHLITMGAPAPVPHIFSPAGPSEGIKVLARAYHDMTPANMKQLVETMVFDNAFATDELSTARCEAALTKPEHLQNWRNWAEDPRNPITYFSLGNEISKITAPSLIVQGRDDRVVPFESALHLVSQIPDSRMVMFNRCGHWAQMEHADEFNRLVIDFVTNS
ncbi:MULTISPECIES: alpha/beta hydrolase [unclassified Gordonia (in: high G+C Gram-positive bacteria)]|uniref:alpha/beta fold hydrolase n=1 Tax=unclassified Gordonia (in: high G+C Gram-positive bacteria) TaxID=2657482 RepID=UPI0009CB0952|nr:MULTISPECIES: alpha/beta hydrolase [unclassified Gordonia (in: high G+C Gram-positive bacteria)]MDF3282996.1 alpha/beta hydrolase [Gordonia sp. N1V]OPX10725.1 alpha/beta hydrolase [Gordonia sp. i37]